MHRDEQNYFFAQVRIHFIYPLLPLARGFYRPPNPEQKEATMSRDGASSTYCGVVGFFFLTIHKNRHCKRCYVDLSKKKDVSKNGDRYRCICKAGCEYGPRPAIFSGSLSMGKFLRHITYNSRSCDKNPHLGPNRCGGNFF